MYHLNYSLNRLASHAVFFSSPAASCREAPVLSEVGNRQGTHVLQDAYADVGGRTQQVDIVKRRNSRGNFMLPIKRDTQITVSIIIVNMKRNLFFRSLNV